MDAAARKDGAPAEQAQLEKSTNTVLSQSYLFQPLAVENAGVLNRSAVLELNALGLRISSSSGEERESPTTFCHMQRFNAILSHNCFVHDDPDL